MATKIELIGVLAPEWWQTENRQDKDVSERDARDLFTDEDVIRGLRNLRAVAGMINPEAAKGQRVFYERLARERRIPNDRLWEKRYAPSRTPPGSDPSGRAS